jgi:hypothetical protein
MVVRRPLAAMAVAAAVLMLPSLVLGTLPTNSSLHNLTRAAFGACNNPERSVRLDRSW